jgi:hypothetical protein
VTTALATPTLDDKPPVLVLSTVQGRLRAHLADWGGKGAQQVQAQLRSLIGVRSARANPLTGNILIHYDRALTDETTLLGALRALRERIADIEASGEPAAKQPPAHVQRDGQTVHARIAVRGMDRNPHLARRVVERLERFPGVRAIASPLTGRVLVEFESVEVQLDDLLTAVANVEMISLRRTTQPIRSIRLRTYRASCAPLAARWAWQFLASSISWGQAVLWLNRVYLPMCLVLSH